MIRQSRVKGKRPANRKRIRVETSARVIERGGKAKKIPERKM